MFAHYVSDNAVLESLNMLSGAAPREAAQQQPFAQFLAASPPLMQQEQQQQVQQQAVAWAQQLPPLEEVEFTVGWHDPAPRRRRRSSR
jgi:hypothetical protein